MIKMIFVLILGIAIGIILGRIIFILIERKPNGAILVGKDGKWAIHVNDMDINDIPKKRYLLFEVRLTNGEVFVDEGDDRRDEL